ncbi:hypothetical protein KFU94_33850 [Chloroflexi bacterium TSY]|nr:hypothetical protein [Chloroflexi bacterium TSY]
MMFSIQILIVTISLLLPQVSYAAPGDVFSNASPALSGQAPTAPNPDTQTNHVNQQTGALTYRYPIVVPPGRLGMAPAIALRYFSDGAVYGGVAAGWSMDIPFITRETSGGTLGESTKPATWTYRSDLAKGMYLIEVEEDEPLASDVSATYRAQFDTQYDRYERLNDSGQAKWRVLHTNGKISLFGEIKDSYERAPLIEQRDAFGNRVIYHWAESTSPSLPGEPSDIYLHSIDYTLNYDVDQIGPGYTQPFARVEFDYSPPQFCGEGQIPIGAHLSYRSGRGELSGTHRLNSIRTLAIRPGSTTLAPVRTYTLNYDEGAQACNAHHAPVRLLTSITESAVALGGSVETLPPVTFQYGPLSITELTQEDSLFTLNHAPWHSGLGWGWRPLAVSESYVPPLVDTMLIDLDGDGRVDQLRSSRAGGECKAHWHRNNGRWLEEPIEINLPTLPWKDNAATPADGEFCALNLQRTRFSNVHPNGEGPREKDASHYNYRFLDMDGDQLPELVVALEHSPYLWPNLDQTPSYRPQDSTPLFDFPLSPLCPVTGGENEQTTELTEPFSIFMPFIAKSGNLSTQDNLVTFQSIATPDDVIHCDSKGPTENSGHVYVECDNGETGYVCMRLGGLCASMHGRSDMIYPEAIDSVASEIESLNDPVPDYHPSWLLPHERCGGFLWSVYKNLGNGEFATMPKRKIQPLPLESTAGNSDMGSTKGLILGSNGFLDLTGDGQLDAFVKLQSLTNWRPGGGFNHQLPPGETTGPDFWSLYSGDGDAGFARKPGPNVSYRWPAPYNSLPRRTVQLSDTGDNRDEYLYNWNDASLTDVNGDGLYDLIWRRPWDNALFAYYNYGQGFFNSWTGDPNEGTLDVTPDGVQYDAEQMGVDGAFIRATEIDTHCTGLGSNRCSKMVTEGSRINTLRTIDLDRDGRPDNLALKPVTIQNENGESEEVFVPAVKYGMGDQLLPPVELIAAGENNPDGMRLVHALREKVDARRLGNSPAPVNGVWQVVSSFLDIDGDGRMDLIENDPQAEEYVSWIKTLQEPTGRPMRLLHTIENGRGGRIDVHYASSHEPMLQDRIMNDDVATGKRLPTSRWLVKQITVNPGYGGATMQTTYRYTNPVYNQDHKGQWGFRGFEEIQEFAPSGMHTDHTYDYSLDYRGLLATSKVYPQGSTLPHSKTERDHALFTLFNNTLMTTHVVQERDFLCRSGDIVVPVPNNENQACDTVKVMSTEWQPQTDNWLAASPLQKKPYLYVPVTRRLADHTGQLAQTGDRGTVISYHLNTLGDHIYRLETKKEERFEVAGSQGRVLIGKKEYAYDAELKAMEQAHVWSGPNDVDRRTTAYTYSATGMKLTRQKPAQFAAGNANAVTTIEYDAYELYPARVTNELGHIVETVYDLGVGKALTAQGPNQRCGTVSCATEMTETAYDGFGRLLRRHISVDDPDQGYRFVQVTANLYHDESGVSQSPHVITEKRRDFDGQIWANTPKVVSATHLDGLGRIIREVTQRAAGGADPVTTYTYDTSGNLASVAVPDPRANDPSQVQYTFTHDSLGRLVELYTPACTGTDCTGVSTRYDGRLTETRERIFDANQGGQAAVKRQWTDAFGRLLQVDEHISNTNTARSYYLYDGNDNLRHIMDADGIVTEMEHNFVGERTRISRGGRTWLYGYDANGNLISVVYPHASNATVADYTTTMGYDDLDRILHKIVGKRDLNAAEQTELLGNFLQTEYRYDEGDNGIGHLTFVGNGLISRTLSYNAQGQVASEALSFDLTPAGINLDDKRERQVEYNPLGGVTQLRAADPTKTELVYAYDERGLIHRVSRGGQELARHERNVAGLVIDRFANSNSHHVEWAYDVLGRIEDLHLQINGQTQAHQDYSYYDSGDASILVEQIAGTTRTVAYGYDTLHQLERADDDLGYTATFAYSPGGRLQSASVMAPANAPRAYPRDVAYDYGQNTDPEQLDQLLNLDGSLYAGYIYDLSGNITERTLGNGERWSVRYDGYEQQRKVVAPDGKSEFYYYVEPSQRALAVTKDASGAIEQVRFYLGETELHYDAQGNITKSWVHANMGTVVARIEDGTDLAYQYHSPQGHLLLSADAANNVQGSFTYGPFGEVLAQIGTNAEHPRQFNGKEYDTTSGLSYYGYRYYDPMSLQWTQADPLYRFAPDLGLVEPRRMSLYTFSLNNPLRYIDPDGRNPGWLKAIWDVRNLQKAHQIQKATKVIKVGNQAQGLSNTVGSLDSTLKAVEGQKTKNPETLVEVLGNQVAEVQAGIIRDQITRRQIDESFSERPREQAARARTRLTKAGSVLRGLERNILSRLKNNLESVHEDAVAEIAGISEALEHPELTQEERQSLLDDLEDARDFRWEIDLEILAIANRIEQIDNNDQEIEQ